MTSANQSKRSIGRRYSGKRPVDIGAPADDALPYDVVVSIASHDSLDALCGCLSTLPAACSGLRWKAVVLQNVPNPQDRVIEERFPWVTVHRNRHPRGFGANHNVVLGSVVDANSSRYALVLNDDTSLSSGAVTSLVADADAHPRRAAVGPATYSPDGSVQAVYLSFPTRLRSLLASALPSVRRAAPIADGRGWLQGSCLLLRVEALRNVGLFDPRFFLFFEDIDLCRRLWGSGWQVAVCRTASITHAAHATVSRPDLVGPMQRQMLRSQYLYGRKHFGSPAATLLAQWTRLCLLLRGLSRLVFRRARNPPGGADSRYLFALARYRPSDPLPHERLS